MIYSILLFVSLVVLFLSVQRWILATPMPDDLLASFPTYEIPKATNRTPDLWAHIILLDRIHSRDDALVRSYDDWKKLPSLWEKREWVVGHRDELVENYDNNYAERIELLDEICAYDDVFPFPQEGAHYSEKDGDISHAFPKDSIIVYPNGDIFCMLIWDSEIDLVDGDRTALRRLIAIHRMFCRLRRNLYYPFDILLNICNTSQIEDYFCALADANELTADERAILYAAEAGAPSYLEMVQRGFVEEIWQAVCMIRVYDRFCVPEGASKAIVRHFRPASCTQRGA